MAYKNKGKFGRFNPNWRGGKYIRKTPQGHYVMIRMSEHPRSGSNSYVSEHILIVENVLGKSLPEGAVIHHVDGNGLNNKSNNLVICQDHAYHGLLHRRQRAFRACGRADWRKCSYCGEYDDVTNLYMKPNGKETWHRKCRRDRDAKQRRLENGLL